MVSLAWTEINVMLPHVFFYVKDVILCYVQILAQQCESGWKKEAVTKMYRLDHQSDQAWKVRN